MMSPYNPRVMMAAALVNTRPGILTREVAAFMRVCDATARSALNTAVDAKMVKQTYNYNAQGWPSAWYPVDLDNGLS